VKTTARSTPLPPGRLTRPGAAGSILLGAFLLAAAAAAGPVPCDPDDGGLRLPPGFCARVFADDLGPARHLAVRDNGDVYVALRQPAGGGGIVALRDADRDGRAETAQRFGEEGGTGIEVYDGFLYFGSDERILRYRLGPGDLAPSGRPEVVVSGFPRERQHAAKPFAFDGAGWLYVNVGAPSNACQERDRSPGSPGLDPCPILERSGGIWRFRAGEPGQVQRGLPDRYATGIRNAVALAWNPVGGALYAVQHGRDQLSGLWPSLYTDADNAELPAEELFLVEPGADYGWPYCYYDHRLGKKVLGPEYGGDGAAVNRCAQAREPVLAFPGHWAPNDLLFYTGDLFPAAYRGGAFVAFHGSWNRSPLPQRGYQVVFVPFSGRLPAAAGTWEVFADGFAGGENLASPRDARFRPMGLAQGPDGSLYVSDSVRGRIWRITFRAGESPAPGTAPAGGGKP